MSNPTSAVLEYFDTDAYLRRNPIVAIRAQLVSQLLAGLPGKRVLDLGCGDGSISKPLLPDSRVTLLDFSEPMLERAKQTIGRSDARYVRANALTWQPDALYDSVLCIGLVAHVDSPEKLVERVAAATRRGGRCIIQITDAGRPLGWLLTRYFRVRRRRRYSLNEISGSQLGKIAARHGLRPVAIRRYGLLIPGTGRLPIRLHTWLEGQFATGLLSRLGAELLVVFEKQ